MVIFALTLVRHGETGHNKDNVIQGQLDVPLSQIGLHQAQLLGAHLQHQKYTHIYASDLSRAKQTAEAILEKSQVCTECINQDARLRERKFGPVEGKSFKFLKEAASKANQSVALYTPPGAETVQQVRQRGVAFFQDLCQLMRGTDSINKNDGDDKHKQTYQQSPVGNGICLTEMSSVPEAKGKTARIKRKREDSYGDGLNKVGCSQTTDSHSVDHNHSTSLSQSSTKQECHICLSAQNRSSDSDYQKRKENENTSLTCNNQCASVGDNHTISPTFTDDVIRSHLTPCECVREDSDCPNVSLSPLVSHNALPTNISITCPKQNSSTATERERRLSVCSSSDENDCSPDLAGNILVVSHGGLLKELVRYFLEELGCSLPGGKKQAMRISPNAGLSKFTVSVVDDDSERPKIICHQIHDRHHLDSVIKKIELAENTAL